MNNNKIISITGAGPAGISAAVQLKRYGYESLLFEKDQIGGLIKNANLIENYPGLPRSVSGEDFVGSLEALCLKHSLYIRYEDVRNIDYSEKTFIISTDKADYESEILIVSSGTKPVKFTDFILPTYLADRIFYEVYHIKNVKDKEVAIVGSGDAAYDYALNLARHNQVKILMRSYQSKCIDILYQRANRNPNITTVNQASLKSVSGCNRDRISIQYALQNGTATIEADYLLFAIGRVPADGFMSVNLKKQAQELEKKQVLYFAGDIVNGKYRQLSIACGDGIKAAMKINEYFKKRL